MKNLKSFIITLFAVLFLYVPTFAQSKISIYIDNIPQVFSTEPIIQDNSTLVPMRELFNKFGYEISWNSNTKTASAKKSNTIIEITIDSSIAYKNGEKINLTTPAIIHNGYTMVPLRFVAESTGYEVVWSDTTYSVLISTPALPPDSSVATLTPSGTLEDTSVMVNSEFSQGSGTIISPDGYIITNYHVLENTSPDKIIIIFNDNGYYYGDVSLIYLDKGRDIAVIKINGENLPYAKIGDSSKVNIGDTVTAIGSPMGVINTKTSGIVLDKNLNYLSTSAIIEHGSSGGGLFNSSDELIGISHSYDDQNNYYSIPINYVDTQKFALPDAPLDMEILKSPELFTPSGFYAYHEDSAIYFHWAQNVDADYYCLFVSDKKNGDYIPMLNPNTKTNQWKWGFPYCLGISTSKNRPNISYYKIASSKDGITSALSDAIRVVQ